MRGSISGEALYPQLLAFRQRSSQAALQQHANTTGRSDTPGAHSSIFGCALTTAPRRCVQPLSSSLVDRGNAKTPAPQPDSAQAFHRQKRVLRRQQPFSPPLLSQCLPKGIERGLPTESLTSSAADHACAGAFMAAKSQKFGSEDAHRSLQQGGLQQVQRQELSRNLLLYNSAHTLQLRLAAAQNHRRHGAKALESSCNNLLSERQRQR